MVLKPALGNGERGRTLPQMPDGFRPNQPRASNSSIQR